MKSILLFKELLGLVEMTSGLVNVRFSLPEWQAVKMIFFAPRLCLVSYHHTYHLNCTCSSCNTPHLRSFEKEIHSICRFHLASSLNVFILRTVYGFLQYDTPRAVVSFFTLPSWIHVPLVRCNPLKNTEYFFSCSFDKKNISLFTHPKRNRFCH